MDLTWSVVLLEGGGGDRPAGRRSVLARSVGRRGGGGPFTVGVVAFDEDVHGEDAAQLGQCLRHGTGVGRLVRPRTIVDDCLKFVKREQKRGRQYDAVIMDPPTFGRGSTGEMWKLEDDLWELLAACRSVLSEQPLFFLVNAYTARLSPTVVANLLSELLGGRGGAIAAGEVGLPIHRDGKVLPCGIYGRWAPEA